MRTACAIDVLERAMTRASLRAELLANNLANVNTPGYKRLDLAFDDVLASVAGSRAKAGARTGASVAAVAAGAVFSGALLRPTVTSAGHLAGYRAAAPAPQVTRASGTSLRGDGNNVDIEAEMAVLAENSLYYQALVREMNNRLSALRLAITEGRR